MAQHAGQRCSGRRRVSVCASTTCTQVLVGFADKLRLMSVLMDDLKLIKEVRRRRWWQCTRARSVRQQAAMS